MWAFSALGGAGLSARSAAQAGLLNGTRSPCVLHTICGRPALAEVTYCQKAPDGRGPDAAGEIRMQVGLGNQLEQAGKHTEPSLTPAVNRRAGAADLRTQRPDGQGRCAMANAATEGILHDDVSRAGARNGGNC